MFVKSRESLWSCGGEEGRRGGEGGGEGGVRREGEKGGRRVFYLLDFAQGLGLEPLLAPVLEEGVNIEGSTMGERWELDFEKNDDDKKK